MRKPAFGKTTLLAATAAAVLGLGVVATTTDAQAQAGSTTPGNSGIRDRDAWKQPGWDRGNRGNRGYRYRAYAPAPVYDGYGYGYPAPAYGYRYGEVVEPEIWNPGFDYYEAENRFERSAREYSER